MGAPAVTNYILAAGGVVKGPIHHAGTVQAVGPVGACGGTARRCHLSERPPAGVPTENKGFSAPIVGYFSHQLAGALHHGPALRAKVGREVLQDASGLFL